MPPRSQRHALTKIDLPILAEMVEEASADTGGGPDPPALFALIRSSHSSRESTKLRQQLVSAACAFVSRALEHSGRAKVVTFLLLLDRTELLLDSPRLQEALCLYVDSRIDSVSPEVADVIVFLLKRRVGTAYASKWLMAVKAQFAGDPSWPLIDVLIELSMLVPDTEYSRADVVRDVLVLSSGANYRQNVLARRPKWACLNLFDEDLLRVVPYRQVFDRNLNEWTERAEAAQNERTIGSERVH